MHEMGIILHMANMLDETAKEQNLTKIGHPVLAESELKLVTIPAVTFCGNCGKTYETVKYGKECPYCHSGETWLVDGNQCVIKEIEAESAE